MTGGVLAAIKQLGGSVSGRALDCNPVPWEGRILPRFAAKFQTIRQRPSGAAGAFLSLGLSLVLPTLNLSAGRFGASVG